MTEAAPNVVIVEDEREIRRFLRAALEKEGCRVFEAGTAAQGLTELATRKPDLVILDLGLPDRNGVELISDLRNWSQVPVVVLSARTDEHDKIGALDAGADDYLTKPFGVGELLARVRAQLRRQHGIGSEAGAVVEFGPVRVDLARRTVERDGQPLHLTRIEYRLLALFIAHAGKVLTHRQILKEVWGPSNVEQNHYLRIYVAHLRQKLERDPARPEFIRTETGIGYRFTV